jgi:Rps23 Pro-64 3,4-dihydroxylase Tpa1-like proline 4-hydroxylase
MNVIDFPRLNRIALEQRDAYAAAAPFPHAVIDDFLPDEAAEQLLQDFDRAQEGWKHYTHYNERKLALTNLAQMPPHTQNVMEALQSQQAIDFVTSLSKIEKLISDPDLEGAGMHLVKKEGFLNIHTDFLTHTKKPTWARRINLLLYLNKDWQDDWHGNLDLWNADMSECIESVAPVFNRCVIFSTIENSFHGHPRKLACPPDVSRKSLLLYYYVDEGRELKSSATDYRATPDASFVKRTLIAADRMLLQAYTFIKRRSKLGDDTISRILKRF